jgi:hypothetical protein
LPCLLLKLFREAHTSTIVLSTAMWSLLIRDSALAWSTAAPGNSLATSCSITRLRFFVKLVGSKLGSSMSMSRNQRNRRL